MKGSIKITQNIFLSNIALTLALRYSTLRLYYSKLDDREAVLAVMKLLASAPGANLKVQCPPEEISLPIITLLLRKNSSVASLPDSNGLSPLLRAASLNKSYISAIIIILDYCPQSTGVCDPSGKNILHLMNNLSWSENREYLLSVPEINALKNRQDSDGNTPAHIAVMNRDICMIQFLMQLSANFAIKNKEGISAADMIQQRSDDFHTLIMAKENDMHIIGTRLMEEGEGSEKWLQQLFETDGLNSPEQYLFLHIPGTGNILHNLISIRPALLETSKVQEFVRQALDSCPFLICETDSNGDTPLHVLAHNYPVFFDKSVLQMFRYYFEKVQQEAGTEELYSPPWRMSNRKGNTPLHQTLLNGAVGIRCLIDFIEFDGELAGYRNHSMDTPLHLLSQESYSDANIKSLKDASALFGNAPSMHDEMGLTPLLRAAKRGNIDLVKLLYTVWPTSGIVGPNKRTVWHMVAEIPPPKSYTTSMLDEFLKIAASNELRSMRFIQHIADDDGNTPLHLAIEKGNFRIAQFIIEYRAPREANILTKRNKKDVTPGDLLGSAEHIPREFEQFLWSKSQIVEDMLGVRSLSGVPTPLIKDYTNTMGVTAALLATITFTAAFTVPGGLNSNNGTPLLMKNAAFQVFMVTDILAMCLSMMVLFCLLWIMTMGNKKESVVLLDLTIFLLEGSFYATLLAFMTGFYVTTFPIISWIAILACALCSSLILIMHKRFITFLIPYFIKIFLVFRQVTSTFGEFLCKVICFVPKSATGCGRKPNQANEGGHSNTGHGGYDHRLGQMISTYGDEQQYRETTNNWKAGNFGDDRVFTADINEILSQICELPDHDPTGDPEILNSSSCTEELVSMHPVTGAFGEIGLPPYPPIFAHVRTGFESE